MPIKCDCGATWKIRGDIFGYSGEAVLACEECGEMYFNAQEFFTEEQLGDLEVIYAKTGGLT